VKVCILTPEFLPAWGGIGTYTYNLARGLRDRAEVHVLTGALSPGYSGLDGVQVHPAFPRERSHGDASPFRFQAAVFRRLPRLMREHGFDIVHANHAYMSDLLARLRRGRASNVVTVHTTLDTQVGGTLRAGAAAPHQGLEGNIARWRFLLEAVERRYLRRTRAMIFVSQWVRDRTLGHYGVAPRLSAIVPNAIDTERLSLEGGTHQEDASPSRPPTLLFAGRLLALKGIDTLLRAMTRVDDTIQLKLAGPGDHAPWRALSKANSSAGSRIPRCRTCIGPWTPSSFLVSRRAVPSSPSRRWRAGLRSSLRTSAGSPKSSGTVRRGGCSHPDPWTASHPASTRCSRTRRARGG